MTQRDERSLGRLVADLSHDMSSLVRGEIELAKAELKESATNVAKGSGMFIGAGFLAYVAFLMLTVAAAFGLVALGLHPALGFLIVAVVYLAISGLLVWMGVRGFKAVGPPKRAMDELEKTKALMHRGNGSGPEL